MSLSHFGCQKRLLFHEGLDTTRPLRAPIQNQIHRFYLVNMSMWYFNAVQHTLWLKEAVSLPPIPALFSNTQTNVSKKQPDGILEAKSKTWTHCVSMRILKFSPEHCLSFFLRPLLVGGAALIRAPSHYVFSTIQTGSDLCGRLFLQHFKDKHLTCCLMDPTQN